MRAVQINIDWNPELSIYASEQYLSSVGEEYGWLGGLDQAGKLRCILPYTVVRKAMVRMVRFRVETIPIGEGLGIEEERAFLTGAVGVFTSMGAHLIIPPTTNAIFRTYPVGAVAAPYGTYIIDLTQTEETLWNKVHSKHRNVIRNAVKKGVQLLSGLEYLDTAYKLVRDTFKRSKLSFMSHEEFKRMVVGLGPNVKVFIADYQGASQGCAVIPFSNHCAYYVYGGTAAEPLTGATNFLQWEAIRFFQSRGVKRYDFCGVRINPEKDSKAAGLMMYKERFGPQLYQGYMWKYPLKPLQSAIYSLAVRLIKGGDIVDAEHHKLKKQLPLQSRI